jgi:hypothetical protein
VASWPELSQELDRWHAAGATATFWWRDDDAADDTPQLDVLLRHAGEIPLALAVVPDLASKELAAKLANRASIVVLQHGWRHHNHSPGGKSEYPATRPMADVSRELVEGRRVMTALFGRQAIPVFSPPWHGFDACFLPLLRQAGLTALSQKGPRPALFAAQGVLQANAHVAPIKWSIPRSFAEDEIYLEQVIDHLRGRRLQAYDASEATGLLTHHLEQNDRSYDFISRLIDVISHCPAGKWINGRDVFRYGNGGET